MNTSLNKNDITRLIDLNYVFNFIVKYKQILTMMFCISFHEYYAIDEGTTSV